MANENVRKIGKKMKKSEAKKWIKQYQKENPKSTHGWLFGDDVIEELLKYRGCEGIWFFKGIDENKEEKLIMLPADENGNILDMKTKSSDAFSQKSLSDDDEAADFSQPCPPKCPSGL